MANDAFRILVGAKIGESTTQLRTDIQQCCDKISVKVKVKLDQTKLKSSIQTQLDAVSAKTTLNIGKVSIKSASIASALKAATANVSSATFSGLSASYDAVAKKAASSAAQQTASAKKIEQEYAKVAALVNKQSAFLGNDRQDNIAASLKKQNVDLSGYTAQLTQIRALRDSLMTGSGFVPVTADNVADFKKLSALTANLQTQYGSLKDAAKKASIQIGDTKAAENSTLAWNKLSNRIGDYSNKISATIGRNAAMAAELNALQKQLQSIKPTDSAALKSATIQFQAFQKRVHSMGLDVESLGQKIQRMFSTKWGYAAVTATIVAAGIALRSAISDVIKIDSEMTQLKIVTQDTTEAYKKFGNEAANAAKAVGASITDIMSSTETYARLGYSLSDALDLATVTEQFSKVAAIGEEEATSGMTAILKGFSKDASDAESIANVLTDVGAKYAVSAGELATALEDGGASLQAANNTLEQSVALVAAGNASIQDASKVGNALKTVSMRIRGATAELEDAGEDVDEFCTSTSKMREEIMALSGVDIMSSATQFKSTYDILLEISKVYDHMSDVNQAALLEDLAGKRNATVVQSILTNVNDLTGAYAAATNSSGALAAATATRLDSIQGKLDQFSATFQSLASDLINSGLIKFVVDLSTGVLGIADSLAKINLLLPLIIASVAAIKVAKAGKNLTDIASAALDTADVAATEAQKSAFKGLSKTQQDLALDLMKASGATRKQLADLQALALQSRNTAEATTELSAAMKAEIAAAQTAATSTSVYGGSFYDVATGEATASGFGTEYVGTTTTIATSNTAGTASNGVYATSFGVLGASIKAAGTALMGFLATPLGMIAAGAAALIAVGASIAAYQKHVKQTAEDSRTELENLNTEVSQLQEKIDQNNQQQLQITDPDDLTRLKNENTELQNRLTILKATQEIQAKETEKASLKALDGYNTGTAENTAWTPLHDRSDVRPAEAAPPEDPFERLNFYVDKISEMKQSLKKLEAQRASAVPESDEWTSLGSEIDYAKQQLETYQKMSSSLYTNISTQMDGVTGVTQDGRDAQDAWNTATEKYANVINEDVVNAADTLTNTIEEATTSVSDLLEEIDKLANAKKALEESATDIKNGGYIDDTTLDSLEKNINGIDEYLLKYRTGQMTVEEFYDSVNHQYELDLGAFQRTMIAKNEADVEFLNKLGTDHVQAAADLAAGYQVDLGNYKNIEDAKIKYSEAIIKKLASAWGIYANATEASLDTTAMQLSSKLWSYEKGSPEYNALLKELEDVNAARASIVDFNSRMDEISSVDIKVPTTTTAKSTSSSGDAYKDAVQQKIDDLKTAHENEEITDQQYYDELLAIENKYYLDSAAHRQKYAKQINTINRELFKTHKEIVLDWLNDEGKYAEKYADAGDVDKQKNAYLKMIDKVNSEITKAQREGFSENSDWMQELRAKLKEYQSDILSLVDDTYSSYISYMDKFNLWDDAGVKKLDVLKKHLADIKALYEAALISWADYYKAYNSVAEEIYSTQKSSIESIIDMTMDMIKQEAEDQVDAIDEQCDAYDKLIEKKKQLLEDEEDESQHQREVASQVKKIADLQSKISQLSLDDSREAQAKKLELEQQLSEAQQELADSQSDYSKDQISEALDDEQSAFKDEKDAEKKIIQESVDSWVKVYNKAIKLIDSDWDGLYDDLTAYQSSYRNSIDGMDSLKTAWETATEAVRQYGTATEALKNISDIALDPSDSSSSAQAILNQMKANSVSAKSNPGTAWGTNGLNAQNKTLAQQYYQLTGRQLVQGSDYVWRFADTGEAAYTLSGSSSGSSSSTSTSQKSVTSQNPYSAPSSTLKINSSGSGVSWLQWQLNKLGYSVPVTGQFYTQTQAALKAFQSANGLTADGIAGAATLAKLKKYHTGGVVDGTGSINDQEVLAILKRGELVLNDNQKATLKNILGGLGDMIGMLTGSRLNDSIKALSTTEQSIGGDTFAPQMVFNITPINGSDEEAKRYGRIVGDTALDALKKAFDKRGVRK